MNKRDWYEERKAVLPSKKQSAQEENSEENMQDNDAEKASSQTSKGKLGKIAVLAGRIMIFLCPALSTANTLFLSCSRQNVAPAAATAPAKIASKPLPNISSSKLNLLSTQQISELDMAFSTVVKNAIINPFIASEQVAFNGISSQNMEQFVNVELMNNENFKLNSLDSVRKFLKNDSTAEVTSSDFTAPDEKEKGKAYYSTQSVSGIKVFASAAIVHTDKNGKIRYVKCNFSRAAKKLITSKAKLLPESIKKQIENAEAGKVTEADSVIYDPELILQKGKICLAWKIVLKFSNGKKAGILVDQSNGKVVFRYDYKTSKKISIQN